MRTFVTESGAMFHTFGETFLYEGEEAMSKTKKAKTAPGPIVPFVRSHTTCPVCGYALAMFNETRGTIHCHSCHRTGTWPPVRSEIEDFTDLLAGLYTDETQIGCVVSAASFETAFGDSDYLVTVTKV